MKVKKRQTRIMVFGTFDGVHKGHLNFFRQARALEILVSGQAKKLSQKPFLIVSVARDSNVLKIKGRRPSYHEKIRMALVRNVALVDKTVLAGLANHIPHIVKERPDIIALGYDQWVYVKNLKKNLKSKGLLVKIVRLKPYKEKIYKSHFLRN